MNDTNTSKGHAGGAGVSVGRYDMDDRQMTTNSRSYHDEGIPIDLLNDNEYDVDNMTHTECGDMSLNINKNVDAASESFYHRSCGAPS